MSMDQLHRLTTSQDGAEAWAYEPAGDTWGWANCGLVADGGEALLIDTAYTPQLTEQMMARFAEEAPDAELKATVFSHSNGDHCWGAQAIAAAHPDVDFIATERSAWSMCREPGPEQVQALIRDSDPTSPMGRYMRANWPFDFADITLVQPTTTFTGRHELTVGNTPVELIEVGPAHSHGDLIVHLPEQRIVFAGDVLFTGHHPVVWSGPIGNIIGALDLIRSLDPAVIVPGHGPISEGPNRWQALDDMTAYLEALHSHAAASSAVGRTPVEAAESLTVPLFARGWLHPERTTIAMTAAYRSFGSVVGPPDMVALVDACARFTGTEAPLRLPAARIASDASPAARA